MRVLLLVCFFMVNMAFAQSEIDVRLASYIKTFSLKPMTPLASRNEKLFKLGRELFFDKILSGNKNISCADCHHPEVMSTDGLPLALGEGSEGLERTLGGRIQKKGHIIARNSPALFNLHRNPKLFWDGRVEFNEATGEFTTPSRLPSEFVGVLKNALAAQALFPMVNHEEMRGQKGTNEIADASSDQEAWGLLFKRVIAKPRYKTSLKEIFPNEQLNLAYIARAIAHFEEQNFAVSDTNYDRYLKGDLRAMTEIQKLGMDVFFNKGKCGECHKGEHLTDFSFHNIGTPQIGPGKKDGDDFGRFEQDPKEENLYAFRVPGLRNAALTAPYMHDGSFKTLAQVIEHYDDIEVSLNEYSFVNNYKNYFENLRGALVETNENKLAHLSTKLTKKLNFEESEEKALAEFIRGALTDKKYLDAEINSDYITSLRIQLKEDGYKKIFSHLPNDAQFKNTIYYYFDVLTSEGYRLRELETPVKIYFTETPDKTTLTYRKQLYKTSGALDGVIAAGTFEDEEILELQKTQSLSLAELNNDFFNRLYTYNTDQVSQEIPEVERDIMKSDFLGMNDLWHTLNLRHFDSISNEMNISKDKLVFAPTSTNTKQEYFWVENLAGMNIDVTLQKSLIRTETGGLTTTWSIELKLKKVTKKRLPDLLDSWLANLLNMGLQPSDAQGTSPSPSKLTERILKGMI